MINNNAVPNIELFGSITTSKLDSQSGIRMDKINEVGQSDFKNMFTNMLNNLNHEVEKPDALLQDLMTGNKNVDIHDVMTAVAKAELGVNIATQITGKVLQTYEKVMQIQV